MSVYIDTDTIDFFIPADEEAAAMVALREADVGADRHSSVAAVMTALGFEVGTTSEGTALVHFSALSRGMETTALAALAPLVAEGSSAVFSAGDGKPWRLIVRRRQLVSQHISWVDDVAQKEESQ
jgi:hypothetical protein